MPKPSAWALSREIKVKQALESKTVIGFLVLLVISCAMAFFGKLTPELVDILKWIGGGFMAVRATANYSENKYSGNSNP